MAERDTVTIPWPHVRPLAIPVTPSSVQEVWDTFVKSAPEDFASPPSVEMRTLMAILRAVYAGLDRSDFYKENDV